MPSWDSEELFGVSFVYNGMGTAGDLVQWGKMIQDNLFPDPHALRSKVIVRRKDFEALFDGFTKLRAVSYVVSPDLLLEFLDRRGYSEVEVVVGENLAETYQQTLAQKGAELTERLAERVEKTVELENDAQAGAALEWLSRNYAAESGDDLVLFRMQGRPRIFLNINQSIYSRGEIRRACNKIRRPWIGIATP